MAEEPATRTFTTSLVRWALTVRLASILVALVLPLQQDSTPRTVIAVALLGGWTLLWLAPGGSTIRLAQRHPILVVVDVLVALTVTALVGVASPLVFATLGTALVIGVLYPPLLRTLLTGVLVWGYVLTALTGTAGAEETFVYSFVIPATYVVLALLGGVTRRLHEQVLAEQERNAATAAAAAAAAERARLARDMHDSVAKSLHGVALAAAALPRWVERDADVAVQQATTIQQAAEQASREARELLVSLRSAHDGPLVERLTRRVDAFREQTGLAVCLDVHGLPDLDPERDHQVLKVVEEALENITRHARATTVRVTVDGDGDGEQVRVVVADDGQGFDPRAVPSRRFGLVGMAERAEAVRGEVWVDSTPGRGTTVTLRLPAHDGAEVVT